MLGALPCSSAGYRLVAPGPPRVSARACFLVGLSCDSAGHYVSCTMICSFLLDPFTCSIESTASESNVDHQHSCICTPKVSHFKSDMARKQLLLSLSSTSMPRIACCRLPFAVCRVAHHCLEEPSEITKVNVNG